MSAPAPCEGMSLAEETSLSQLRQRLQRDINCLSDQDRTTRRRALTKLQQVFFQEAKVKPPLAWRDRATIELYFDVTSRGQFHRSATVTSGLAWVSLIVG